MSDHYWQAFTQEYPPGKGASRDFTRKLFAELDPQVKVKVLEGLQAWKRSEQWNKEGGRYIPSAANFLLKEKWKDKLPVSRMSQLDQRTPSFDSEAYWRKAQDPETLVYKRRHA